MLKNLSYGKFMNPTFMVKICFPKHDDKRPLDNQITQMNELACMCVWVAVIEHDRSADNEWHFISVPITEFKNTVCVINDHEILQT